MLASLQSWLRRDRVLYTQHARREMREEPFGRIAENEVSEAPLVCAYAPEDDRVIIVTVYEPDPGRWIDLRRRVAP